MRRILPIFAALLFWLSGTATANPGIAASPAFRIMVTRVTVSSDALDGTSSDAFTPTRPRNDLAVLQAVAAKRKISLLISPIFAVTTFANAEGSDTERLRLPYLPLPNALGVKPGEINYVDAVSGLTVTPHINSDGTVAVRMTFTISDVDNDAWRELGPPKVTSRSVTTTRTLDNGETVFLFVDNAAGQRQYLYYVTLTQLPTLKG